MGGIRFFAVRRSNSFCLVLFIFFTLAFCSSAFAINASTITKVNSATVVPDVPFNVAATSASFEGNAEAGTTIKLYRNGLEVATTVTDAAGAWTTSISSQPEGFFEFTAVADDGTFTSEPSTGVEVVLDVTAPSISIWYGNSGCRSNAKYQCSVSLIYANVSDSLSGIDFSTAAYAVDVATMPTTGDPDTVTSPAWVNVAGSVENDGTSVVNFYPDDWGKVRQPYYKVRLSASIKDEAGNSISQVKTFYMCTGLRPAAPIIEKIWDPGHNVFTGTGETTANIPDGEGFVNYFPGMTVVNNPIKVKGHVTQWNAPDKGWYAAYMTDATYSRYRIGGLNTTTGEFVVEYPGKTFPYGDVRLDLRACDTGDCLGRNAAYADIKTLTGAPYPRLTVTPSGEPKVIGSRLWPTFTGTLKEMPFNQTIQIGWGDYSYDTWKPELSQVVPPNGVVITDTPGVYDIGDVWDDDNDNGQWDAGEAFHDMPARTSDGSSFTLVNFRGLEYKHNTLSYLGILTRNTVGKSKSNRVVRAHNNDTYPPLLKGVELAPEHPSIFRRSSEKPDTITVNAQTWAGNYSGSWSWSGNYALNYGVSILSLTNGQGTNIALPAPTWSHLGKNAYQTDLDISAVALPEATYQINVTLEDNMTMRTENSSYSFKIDNSPPYATDIVPADGALSNSFTSFSAKVVDPNLADGSSGSGANIDVSKAQIWPFRILSLPAKVTQNGKTTWDFTLADSELNPNNHQGDSLSVGDSIEIWESVSGVYQSASVIGTINSIYGNGTFQIKHPATFTRNKTYVIMFPIPFFTSNNGVDRVGAVPVSPVEADGTYVTKIVTRDKAENTGTYITTSSPLEVPVGLISYTFDKPFLFCGLIPNDIGTYTTSAVKTRKNNPVIDGQALSLVQMPKNLSVLSPADSNGIPGDGHQVLFGKNGAAPGSGQACFGVRATTTAPGSVSIFGVIGLASGTSPALNIYQVDSFTAAPTAATLDITPTNPSPVTNVKTSVIGKSPRVVPDGSLATCTTNFGTLSGDVDAIRPGIQAASVAGKASVNITSNTKGAATVIIEMGGRSASAIVNFRDKYPPLPPSGITLSPSATNTGASTISWDVSTDFGGAGVKDYTIEQSFNGGAFVAIATTTSLSHSLSGLADGSYMYRIRARDNDNNIGNVSAEWSLSCDNTPPPAVNCSDIGPGNLDPDEEFSLDSNVFFYFNPVDAQSGVGEVQIQVSITSDTSGLVVQPWIPAATQYMFPNGVTGRTYFARIRVKDKAGNIGPWGSWSNGIFVNITGAVTPPNAPTIAQVQGINAVPGVPVPLNITTGITISGQSEASNLVKIYIDGVYNKSTISDGSGNFSGLADLSPGNHTVKVKAHNGFAESGFSNEISIVIDTTPPTMIKRIYDQSGYVRGERFLSASRAAHKITTFDFFLTDSGGSGFDIDTAKVVVTDVDDSMNPVLAVGTYTNPIAGAMSVIAADRVRFVPDVAWNKCLQVGHRYKIAYEVDDFAGNKKAYTFDFVLDETLPGECADVPAVTIPAKCNIKKIYIYDTQAIPWSTWPAASDLVPLTWDTGENAWMIDPAFVNPALVDTTTTPHSIKFNTIGFYGCLYGADPSEPPVLVGQDARTRSFFLAWGYGSDIYSGPDPIGNINYFRFNYRTMTNGLNTATIGEQDWAICRNYYTTKIWVNSPNPAPNPPTGIEFSNAANPAEIYPIWTSSSSLFGTSGGLAHNRHTIITDNSNALIVKVTVPAEIFEQRVEIIESGSVINSSIVSPGNTTAVMTIDKPTASARMTFQVRSYANGYYSTNLPAYKNYIYYQWVKGDTTAPETYDVFPVETNYNALAGADARPFPSQFSAMAKDTTDGSLTSFLEVGQTSAVVESSGGTPLAGTLYRDYNSSNTTYGYRYQLSSIPTTEGTYNYKVALKDAARLTAHSTTSLFPFKLDKTAPAASEVNPSDGAVTNSLPSFNARVGDPLLADGTPGSGPNMDPSRKQVYPFKSLGKASATSGTSLSATIYGIDTVATDHVDNNIPLNTTIWYAEDLGGGAMAYPATQGKITGNSGDTISTTVTSGPNLTVGKTYAIIYEIPNFASNDGIDRIAAVPIQPAVKGGAYIVFLKLMDNSLNQATYSSASSIYEAAYGTFGLTPGRTSLYVGLYPPHTSNFVSDPILTTEGNPISINTEVTMLTSLGSFSPADSNGIPGDGHQVQSDATGRLNFGLQATGLNTGTAYVRAVLGLASGTDNSVSFVQIPPFSVSLDNTLVSITPTTPNPVINGVTSAIGNSGDLVPNGTCLNLYTDLGTFAPADAYGAVSGHQVTTTSGVGNFSISSNIAGLASFTIEMGGRTQVKTVTFLDRYPPNAPGQPTPDNTLNNTGVFNLIWAASTDPAGSGIGEYGVEYSLDGGAYTHLASSTTTGYITSGLGQGIYKFRVIAVDNAGNVGAYSPESVSCEVDTTPPLGSIFINSGAARTGSTNVTLTLSATDAKGVADMSFSNDNTTWSSWIAYATTQAWTIPSGDGSKVVYARFRDTLGNIGVVTDNITLDTTGPLGGVSCAPAPYSATSTISITLFAADSAGVPTMSVSFDGGAYASMTYDPLYLWNVSTTFATHTVRVKYLDSLGNESPIYTGQTCIDTQVPTIPVVTDDGTYSPWLDKLHATWSASDAQSGLSHYLVKVGTSAGASDIIAEINAGMDTERTFGPLALDITGATQYYFTVIAVDRAGNRSPAGNSNGIKGGDPTPPLVVSVTDDGAYSKDATKLHASWNSSSDPDSGINRYEFSAGTSAGASNIVPWTNCALNLNYTATGLSLSHGTKYWINVRIWNNGGSSTTCSSDGITIDTVAPPVPTMNAIAAFTGSTTVSLGCSSVNDALSGGTKYMFQKATDAGFSAGLADSGWITTNSHTFTGQAHNTHYYYRVRTSDAVANISAYSAAVDSVQDSVPPVVTEYTDNVAANNDPSERWSKDYIVSFTAVGLSDPVSGKKNVLIELAKDSGFTQSLGTAFWLHNTTGDYTTADLSGSLNSGDWIYARAKFEDIAGNQSAWFKTNGIQIDSTLPAASGTSDDTVENYNDRGYDVSSDATINFKFDYSDSLSGVSRGWIQISSDDSFSAIVLNDFELSATDLITNKSFTYNAGVDGVIYYARIKVQDLAGNMSATYGGGSNGIRVDLSAPSSAHDFFYINKKDTAFEDEKTTATRTVHISLDVADPSGVSKAQFSHDGVNWIKTVNNPKNYGVTSYSWQLEDTPGIRRVYMRFEDGIGHVSLPQAKEIGYYPSSGIFEGTIGDDSYPTDTYDEYRGQNKYGTDRSNSVNPVGGKSLKLEKK